MKVSLPYEINDKMVIISKEDYDRCVLRGLITTPSSHKIKQERLLVKNTKYYPGHPETGGSTKNGVCPHCGRHIQQRDYNEEDCDYCGGSIKWSFWG